MAIDTNKTADTLIRSYINHEFVWEGDIITLTGRYATHVQHPGAAPNLHALATSLHVEIKSIDKDTPQLHWARFSDLKVIQSIYPS